MIDDEDEDEEVEDKYSVRPHLNIPQ